MYPYKPDKQKSCHSHEESLRPAQSWWYVSCGWKATVTVLSLTGLIISDMEIIQVDDYLTIGFDFDNMCSVWGWCKCAFTCMFRFNEQTWSFIYWFTAHSWTQLISFYCTCGTAFLHFDPFTHHKVKLKCGSVADMYNTASKFSSNHTQNVFNRF